MAIKLINQRRENRMKKQLLILLGMTIILSACSGPKELSDQQKMIANLTNEKLCASLVKGVTSQEDVKKLFGEPYSTTLNNQQETTYFYKVIESKSSEDYVPFITSPKFNNTIKALNITFERNVVKEYELNQRTVNSSSNLSAYNSRYSR